MTGSATLSPRRPFARSGAEARSRLRAGGSPSVRAGSRRSPLLLLTLLIAACTSAPTDKALAGIQPGWEASGRAADVRYDPTPAPSPTSPLPSPIGTRAASTEAPRTATPPRHTITGPATWFRSPAGVSAAGPLLRKAIGASWRGTRVRVCASGRCIVTALGDWCACGGGRLIDLDSRLFGRLAPLGRGVIRVEVTW